MLQTPAFAMQRRIIIICLSSAGAGSCAWGKSLFATQSVHRRDRAASAEWLDREAWRSTLSLYQLPVFFDLLFDFEGALNVPVTPPTAPPTTPPTAPPTGPAALLPCRAPWLAPF